MDTITLQAQVATMILAPFSGAITAQRKTYQTTIHHNGKHGMRSKINFNTNVKRYYTEQRVFILYNINDTGFLAILGDFGTIM
jgi:hypothetical protein